MHWRQFVMVLVAVSCTTATAAHAQPSEAMLREAWVQRLASIGPACRARPDTDGTRARHRPARRIADAPTRRRDIPRNPDPAAGPGGSDAVRGARWAAATIGHLLILRGRADACAIHAGALRQHRGGVAVRASAPAPGLDAVADGVRLLFVQALATTCQIRSGNWQDDALRTALLPFAAARSVAQAAPIAPRQRRHQLLRLGGAETMARAAARWVHRADAVRYCAAVANWPELWRLDAGVEERRSARLQSAAAAAPVASIH